VSEQNLEKLAEFEALRQELARRKLLGFAAFMKSSYQPNWHHAVLAQELDDVLSGKTKRLIVNMPPQHGKSELVSRNFPAYALGRRPDIPIIHCSYNADLATEMSRDVQQLMDTEQYRAIFPGTRLASSKDTEVRMAAQFDVVNREGSYRAAGVGQGITGKSMMLGIIDDPIKSRAEAESETYRRLVWNWYVADFSTRQMGDECAIVLVQTRWHEDDLAGRLLKIAARNPEFPQWRVVSFPAIAEQKRDGDPRAVGDALWPTRFSLGWLNAEKAIKGSYDWSALYQQNPIPAGGAMANRDWFQIGRPRGGVMRRIRCWDLAATKPTPGREPDWTVGTLLAQHTDDEWCVEDVIRVRETANYVDQLIKTTARADGQYVRVREWQDPGAAGKAVIESHRQMLRGYDYEPLPASGEKSLQWRPFFVKAEDKKVWLKPSSWNDAWLGEISTVPYGTHDDQADSVAGAYNTLSSVKDYGPSVAAVMPEHQTASGPVPGAWQESYFRRK
jgi:predicted phage terminase large subunit-like protein